MDVQLIIFKKSEQKNWLTHHDDDVTQKINLDPISF